MNRPAVSEAKMRRAKRAMEAEGVAFGGYRLHPDGCVDVLPANASGLTAPAEIPSPAQSIDAEIDDWAAKHGYG